MKGYKLIAFALCLSLAFVATHVHAEEFYIPKAAEEAIDKSQGILTIVIPLVNGQVATRQGNAFLVSDDGLIVTALHILPPEYDVLNQGERLKFRGISATVALAVSEFDLAVLKLESVPEGMRPIPLATDVELYADVFAKFKGLWGFSENMSAYFRGLPFRAKVVEKMMPVANTPVGPRPIAPWFEYIYLDRAAKGGFSGNVFVSASGEAAGMGLFVEDGYTGLLSAKTIREIVENVKRDESNSKNSSGVSSEEKSAIKLEHEIIDQMLELYSAQALERPKSLASCVREMRVMRPLDECRDRFSHVSTAEEVKSEKEDIKGEFGGVGLEITMRDGFVVVVSPIPDTPAFRAGVKPGDMILEVDGIKVKSLKDVVSRMRGLPGTAVKLKVARERLSKPLEFEIVREKIIVKAVKTEKISGTPEVGVLKIQTFSREKLDDEVSQALEKFAQDGIQDLVLDLRNNPGGLLYSALRVLAFFMRLDDIMISIRTRAKTEVYDRAMLEQRLDIKEFGKFRNFNLVVLVNGGSASASELTAGALKDWGYVVIGEETFKKGVGQMVFPLKDGSAFFLTTFEFLVGNSKTPIRDKGVALTEEVKNLEEGKDRQLERAVEILRSK